MFLVHFAVIDFIVLVAQYVAFLFSAQHSIVQVVFHCF